MVRVRRAACGRKTAGRHPSDPHLSGRDGHGRRTVAAALVLILPILAWSAAACRREYRRTPYIPPQLANWTKPYRGVRGLHLHVLASTGSLAPPGWIVGGPGSERRTLEVPVFVVRHPRAGPVLIGTGLDPALVEMPANRLGWWLAALTEPTVAKDAGVVAQLGRLGIAVRSVRHIVLLDCRFPQTGQLRRFPDADVIVSARDRAWAMRDGGGAGVRRDDLADVERWKPVSFEDTPGLGTVPHAHDVLGDGSLWLLDLPGYTPGSTAVLVRLPEGPVVLGGGVVPFAETLRMPSVPWAATDPDAWWLSAWRVKRFRELADGLTVFPGYDVGVPGADRKNRKDVTVHREADPAPAPETPRDPPARPPSFPVPDPPALPPPPPR